MDTLEALRLYVAIAETGSFSAAARQVSVSTSTVTVALQQLEEQARVSLTSHPEADKISFTGSTQTGRRVFESASQTLKHLTLELGGNDAGIVLRDVDVDAAIAPIFWGMWLSGPAGQTGSRPWPRPSLPPTAPFGCVRSTSSAAGIRKPSSTTPSSSSGASMSWSTTPASCPSRRASLKVEEWDRMIDVNIRGVLHGIAAVLPGMQAQGFGQIINISSIGGLHVTPTAAIYCATKFAVRAISDGLRQETDKIRVTIVCPGVTESELAESISDEAGRNEMKTFRKIAIPADAVARAVAYAIEQPNDVDVSELVVRPTASPF
jgi:NAD(P)-dependent dehydrogenase (short-subunit alcohol dehydrogenase family)